MCDKGHEFKRTLSNFYKSQSCPICFNGKSKYESEIYEFLSDNITSFISLNNRSILDYNLELDLYIPDKNLAIEFNGLCCHSESWGKYKNYHLDKTLMCEKINIQLLHIFEDEWINKKDIVKSTILSKMGIFKNRIYARKCIVEEIDTKTKNEFLEENHLQGKDSSSIKLGLFYNNELVSVMTFGRRKITGGNSKSELIRFCSKLNTQIIGGANKLFKYFINNYWNGKEITTYADRR
jgi:hypothetical protein